MIYLISLIAFCLPTYLIRFSIAGIPMTALEILIYLSVIYYLVLIISKKIKFRLPTWKIALPVGLLLTAAIISTIIAPDLPAGEAGKHVALGQLKAFFIDPILVFLLITNLTKYELGRKNLIIQALIASGTIVAIITICQYFFHHVSLDNRVIGIYGYSPNYIALFLVPVAVLSIGNLLSVISIKKTKQILFYGLIALIMLMAIYLSGSRGGFLAVGVGLAILLYYFFKEIKWLKFLILAFGVIFLVGGLYLAKPNFSASPTTPGRASSSNNIRWEIWKTSIEMIKQKPILGVGLGNYQNYFSNLTKNRGNYPEWISPMALTPHNIFLMFWLSTGILGLVAFIWLLVAIIWQGNFQIANRYILFAILITILIQGLVDTPYWKNDLAVLFWIIAGLILIQKQQEKNELA